MTIAMKTRRTTPSVFQTNAKVLIVMVMARKARRTSMMIHMQMRRQISRAPCRLRKLKEW